MEQLIDTMATESTNNGETILGSMVFNNLTEITVSNSRLDYFFALEKKITHTHTHNNLPAAIALSKHSRVTSINFLPASSTFPTQKVALESPWKPL